MKYILSIAISLLILSACSTVDYTSPDIRKGLSKAELIQIIDGYSYFDFPGTVEQGLFDITQEIGSKETTEIILCRKNVATGRFYMFALEDGKLIYWGYPYEFNNSPNEKYNRIGSAAIKKIRQVYAKDLEA